MIDLELPIGKKRTPLYRAFEMLPGLLSYGMLGMMVVLSLVSPLLASAYLLIFIMTMIVKALGIAFQSIQGHRRLVRAQKIDWSDRLEQLEDPVTSYERIKSHRSRGYDYRVHQDNLRLMAASPDTFPKPSEVYNAVIIAAYNEPYDVIAPTFTSLIESTYESKRMIVVFAYEERGGAEIAETARKLKKQFGKHFKAFLTVEHPDGASDEVIGKGPNITHAAYDLERWCTKNNIAYSDVIITTLDCDNKPHAKYFDYVTYEYIVHEDRKRLSYQPIALYFSNIWDAPAPMRVIATGNSFWTLVSSMRPHSLRNFAAHAQPMDALSEMDYWSKRSIVEDGHQYWRSYFYFGGDYNVIPLYVPIYQDAVLAETFKKTLVAQFKQLRRWGYGVSDIPYVAVRIFTQRRNVPFWPSVGRFIRLIDSHVTLATVAILVAVGGWIPLFLNAQATQDIAAHNLPEVVSYLQRIAMFGLFVTILLSIRSLPRRPERYKRHRTVFMVLQWVLLPVTSIAYNAIASLNAQTHLLFGRYLDKFDVTEKVTREQLPEDESEA